MASPNFEKVFAVDIVVVVLVLNMKLSKSFAVVPEYKIERI